VDYLARRPPGARARGDGFTTGIESSVAKLQFVLNTARTLVR
jgi:hypothetical protein